MPKREAKIHDAEVLAWAYANLQVGSGLPMGVIENLAWEQFKRRGVLRHGFGGKIRRLFPAHCSAFPHRFKGPDLFVYEDGLWSLKADVAQAPTPIKAQTAA